MKKKILIIKEVSNDEPIVFLDMQDSTKLPNGTYKRYLSRIDPNAYDGETQKSIWAAQASRWRRKDGSLYFSNYKDYWPTVET